MKSIMHFVYKVNIKHGVRVFTERSLNDVWNLSIWPPVDSTVNVIPGHILRSNHVTLKEISLLL